ncbi:MAG: TfoX/Sxy family protein [Alphaproteobacteria bacterium]
MAKTTPFVERVVARLAPLGPVRARGMFGGFGVYLDDLMFALIAWDRLFFKVDDATKRTFAEAGGAAFVYDQGGQAVTMSYWEPPRKAFASAKALMPWAELGLAAARRARAAKRGKGRGKAAPSRVAPTRTTPTKSRRTR